MRQSFIVFKFRRNYNYYMDNYYNDQSLVLFTKAFSAVQFELALILISIIVLNSPSHVRTRVTFKVSKYNIYI